MPEGQSRELGANVFVLAPLLDLKPKQGRDQATGNVAFIHVSHHSFTYPFNFIHYLVDDNADH